MGTYNLDDVEIADAMEKVELDNACEGDYTEKDFISGAKIYLNRLRKRGMYLPKK